MNDVLIMQISQPVFEAVQFSHTTAFSPVCVWSKNIWADVPRQEK